MRLCSYGLVGLTLLIAGCGGSEAKTATAGADREASVIRKTVLAAKREATDGSAKRTCRYITVAGQLRAIKAYSRTYQRALHSCPEMIRFARKAEAAYLNDARRATVRRVKVRGARATVTIEGPRRGGGDPAGALLDFSLKKLQGKWKVDDAPQVLPAGQ